MGSAFRNDDIAFLRAYGIGEHALEAAYDSARAANVSASTALIRGGGASETLFYFTLAQHLGLAFVWDLPEVQLGTESAEAALSRRIRLANGRWLIAPTGTALRILIAARRRGDELGHLAITTPAHLAAIVRRRFPAQIAHAAGAAFPEQTPRLSARGALRTPAAITGLISGLGCIAGLYAGLHIVIDLVDIVFFAALVFRLLTSAAGHPTAAEAEPRQAKDIEDAAAPTYSVLVPLYAEASVVPGLVDALCALDYPRAKLEILFLVEDDDVDTRIALLRERLPEHMRVVIVPRGEPRTKPRALNVGLLFARGALITVYDAEDRPDVRQLRQAASLFAVAPPEVACLQAHLAVTNGAAGLIPKLFSIEYAALFDLYNVGTARLALPIALGGTSNHFRTAAVRRSGGWDAFNVTEDADLGLRLARFGYVVGDLPSTTGERAEQSLTTWFNQRRRWTKGWMQTTLVLMRGFGAVRDLGFVRACAVALMLVNLVIGPLLSPFALLFLALFLGRSGLPCADSPIACCEATLAASVFALGIVAPIWCGYVGSRARGLRGIVVFLPLLIPYQLMISAAAWGGLIDLVVKPHHWRKTRHTVFAPSETTTTF